MHVGNTIGYSNGMETGWKDENEHELYYGYAMLISQSDSIAVSQSHDRIVRFYTISILHSNSHCTKTIGRYTFSSSLEHLQQHTLIETYITWIGWFTTLTQNPSFSYYSSTHFQEVWSCIQCTFGWDACFSAPCFRPKWSSATLSRIQWDMYLVFDAL